MTSPVAAKASEREVDQALARVQQMIIDYARHGYGEIVVTVAKVKAGKVQLIVRGGRSYSHTILEHELN
jgi:hypothetical protein